MNDLTKLLEKLANKLGTTVELLWSVLLKQAYISAITELILCLFLIIFCFLSTKFVIKKTKKRQIKGSYWEEADWDDEGAFIAWAGLAVLFIGVLLYVCIQFSIIINGIFNPEFIALSYILSHIH